MRFLNHADSRATARREWRRRARGHLLALRAAERKRGAARFFGRCRAGASVRQSGVRRERQNQACMMCSTGKRVAQTQARSFIFECACAEGENLKRKKLEGRAPCACAPEAHPSW